jgi:hypothetical protein
MIKHLKYLSSKGEAMGKGEVFQFLKEEETSQQPHNLQNKGEVRYPLEKFNL